MTLAIAVAVALPAAAQQKKGQKKGRGVRLSVAARALARIDKFHTAMKEMELTDDQKEAIKKIHEEVGSKIKAAMDQLKEILTDQQQEAIEQAAKKAKEAGKKGWQFFRAVDAAVKPTEEQKEKLDKVGKQLLALQKSVAAKINEVLTEEQKETLKKKMAAHPRAGHSGRIKQAAGNKNG